VQLKMVCKNDKKEQVFFTAKVFTLQEVTIVVQGNVDKMPLCFDMTSNYTTDDVGANYAIIRTSGNEKMWL
jgi:hypothetical protein